MYIIKALVIKVNESDDSLIHEEYNWKLILVRMYKKENTHLVAVRLKSFGSTMEIVWRIFKKLKRTYHLKQLHTFWHIPRSLDILPQRYFF